MMSSSIRAQRKSSSVSMGAREPLQSIRKHKLTFSAALIAVFILLLVSVFSLDEQEYVLLSFDVEPVDGEDSVVFVLDALSQRDIEAIFFVTGEYAESFPEVTRRIISDGHELGCHTYSHPFMTKLSYEQKMEELSLCVSTLERVANITPLGFRAPYNRVDNELYSALSESGFRYDASQFRGWQWLLPAPGIPEVGISTFALVPLEDVIWLYYAHFPASWYFALLAGKADRTVSFLFHPRYPGMHQEAFLRFLDGYEGKNVTFIKHFEFILSHNE